MNKLNSYANGKLFINRKKFIMIDSEKVLFSCFKRKSNLKLRKKILLTKMLTNARRVNLKPAKKLRPDSSLINMLDLGIDRVWICSRSDRPCPGLDFTNMFTYSFNACGSQKHKITPGVNFTNVLSAAFMLVGPKSAK